MKSRLEPAKAELIKLKNQIRLELNKIRPHHEIYIFEKENSKKKQF
jgi:hypothetical protein